jgi:DNA-binding NtrC family response regulator
MPSPISILIVDDEPIKTEVLKDALNDAGYDAVLAVNPLEAKPILSKRSFDVVVTDIRMAGQDGISFLRDIKAQDPEQAVIVMTAFGTVESAVEAMKLGAFDYLQKPFSAEELMLKLDRLVHYLDLERENRALRRRLRSSQVETTLIGRSAAMRQVLSRIHAVAHTDARVLIQGESGTGKEVVARVLHESSHRNKGPFIPVSCAALPESLIEAELFGHEAGAFTGAAKKRLGRFEMADGGTLFLDDIDDIPLSLQVKLLRVIQEGQIERVGAAKSVSVNFRLIAATKVDLAELAREGEFREDLYYRLSVVPILLPPLRDRRDDIPLLAAHFLETLGHRQGAIKQTFSSAAIKALKAYTWPGNVRQLQHVVEQCMVLTPTERIDSADLPDLPAHNGGSTVSLNLDHADKIDLTAALEEAERGFLKWALDRAQGNLAQAAQLLAVPRSTLQYRMSKLGLDEDRN